MGTSKLIDFERPASFYYAMARDKYNEGEIPGAIARARSAVRRDPNHVDSKLLLSELLLVAGLPEEALQLLFELVDRDACPNMECAFLLGIGTFFIGAPDAAVGFLNAYLDIARLGMHVDIARYARRVAAQCESRPDAAVQLLIQCALAEVRRAVFLEIAYPYTEYIPHNPGTPLQLDVDTTMFSAPFSIFNQPSEFWAQLERDQVLTNVDFSSPAAVHENEERCRKFCHVTVTLRSRRWHAWLHNYLDKRTIPTIASRQLVTHAIAAHNAGYVKDAICLLSDQCVIDEADAVARHCLSLLNEQRRDEDSYETLPYMQTLPKDALQQHMAYLASCECLADDDLVSHWQSSAVFHNAVKWALVNGDEETQRRLCALVARVGDVRADRLLRHFLLLPDRSAAVKNDVMAQLQADGARMPLQTVQDGVLKEYDGTDTCPLVGPAKARFNAVVRDICIRARFLHEERLVPCAVVIVTRAQHCAGLADAWETPHDIAAAALRLSASENGRQGKEEAITFECNADPVHTAEICSLLTALLSGRDR